MSKSSRRTFYRSDLAESLSTHFGFGRRVCGQVVSLVFADIERRLAAGGRVVVSGFGEFHVKRVGAKVIRSNLRHVTWPVHIAAHRLPAFAPAAALKARVFPPLDTKAGEAATESARSPRKGTGPRASSPVHPSSQGRGGPTLSRSGLSVLVLVAALVLGPWLPVRECPAARVLSGHAAGGAS